MILRARGVLAGVEGGEPRVHAGGGLEVTDGRVARVLRSAGAVRRAVTAAGGRATDLGEGWIVPGLVNAHAHLELTDLQIAPRPFADWVGAILRARARAGGDDWARAVGRGERRLLETGTTAVGDITTPGPAATCTRLLRTVVFREVLDGWDARRTTAALGAVARALPCRRLRTEGLAPHAPYTTSTTLLERLASLLERRPMPVSVHWSETEAELAWLRDGGGPLAPFLPPSPACRGLDLLERSGLLRRGTSLVHGNLPGRGEPARLARAGVVLVHCPGTHLYFDRPAFPWRRYERAGVPIALGTDSRASNADLDMRREMALVRAARPGLQPARVLEMATRHAARALGQGETIGLLERGRAADFALHADLPARPPDLLDALTSGGGEVRATWVAGRRIRGTGGPAGA